MTLHGNQIYLILVILNQLPHHSQHIHQDTPLWVLQVQKHFDVYRGSKASHPPVLLMRRSARAPWLRVEGFPDAAELVALIESLPAAG